MTTVISESPAVPSVSGQGYFSSLPNFAHLTCRGAYNPTFKIRSSVKELYLLDCGPGSHPVVPSGKILIHVTHVVPLPDGGLDKF